MKAEFLDSEELAQTIRHTKVQAVQLSKGKFRAELSRHCFDDWTLQSVSFFNGTSVCAGDGPSDRYALVVPGSFVDGSKLLGRAIDQSTVAVYAPGSEHVDVSQPGTNIAVIVLPKDLPQDDLIDSGLWQTRGSQSVTVSPLAVDRLRNLLRSIHNSPYEIDQVLDQSETRRGLRDELIRGLLDVSQHVAAKEATRGRPLAPRSVIVRRTLEILRERGDVPIYVTELAAEVGTSQPTLQRLFLEWFGMPPARYLQMKRYYIARQRLRDGSAISVTEVAMSLGFWDLSRFSRGYKSIFGELPSQTLRGPRVR